MKQNHRKQLGISLKLFLFVGLFFNLYFEVVAKGNIVSQEIRNDEKLNLNDRMSKIEAENQQHKNEISILKTVVEEDIKAIAILTIKVDEEHATVNNLKSHIERLEKSALNYSNTKESLERTANSITRNKREAGKTATPKLTKNPCAGSSHFCTFYYPDHPDVLRERNSTTSQNKNVINSDCNSIVPKTISNPCSESSRLCTFAHPDHPGALSAIKSNIRSYSPVFNSVNEEKPIISGNQNSLSENNNNTGGARFYGPPTNCSDLERLGHTLNGYYLVKGSGPSTKNKIVTVYCAFHQSQQVLGNQGIHQTQIGTLELKAKSVFFFVAMTENLESGNLAFKRFDVNEGGAMRESKFIAPVAGIYHFQLNAIVHNNVGNNFIIAMGVGGDFHLYTKIDCQNCSTQFVSMVRTCHLNANDEVWLYKPPGTSGIIAGGGPYDAHSNFAGWLVEEDIVFA